jgi:TonB family protein
MHFDPAGKGTLTLLGQPPKPAHRIIGPSPRLELRWDSRWRNFGENLLALLREPTPPKKFCGAPYFRDCWVSGPLPDRAFFAALLWHAAAILLLTNFGQYIVYEPHVTLPRVEITWYGPVNDLPVILPAAAASRPKPQTKPAPPALKRGADAFHPRQTILNRPVRPNHPRQTLIQPASPPEPPKILPSLPNIVAWNEASQPELRIDPALLRQMAPKGPAAHTQPTGAAPQMPNQEKLLGAVDIAALDTSEKKPALPITLMSTPRAAVVRAAAEPPPNLVGADASGSDMRLIALSATPGPAMPPAVPAGNLSSRVAISPEGPSPGSPSSSPHGVPEPSSSASHGSGPAGLSITGGRPAGLIISGVGHGGRSAPVMPGITAAAPPHPVAPIVRSESGPLIAALKPGMKPEGLLGANHVYTLLINMPDMTSASGSWILSFSALAPEEESSGKPDPVDLQGPEPLHEVDPKYPPELRDSHIQGEVVLYAVIRKDGTVDSIQLVEGIDPTLDADAMRALAQWKFRPAERHGHPIELQAIVHIPFRAVAPIY